MAKLVKTCLRDTRVVKSSLYEFPEGFNFDLEELISNRVVSVGYLVITTKDYFVVKHGKNYAIYSPKEVQQVEAKTKKQINSHEKKLAKRLGGRTTPASGAKDAHKGDIKVGEFLIDDKSTVNNSISITKDMLVKINREARESGKNPCLSISFHGDMGLAGSTWYLVPERVFREII
jgi:hypothetical protein